MIHGPEYAMLDDEQVTHQDIANIKGQLKIITLVLTSFFALASLMGGWAFVTIINHDKTIENHTTKLESMVDDEFNKEDGLKLHQELSREINDGPRWLSDQLQRMQNDTNDLKSEFKVLRGAVEKSIRQQEQLNNSGTN